MSPLISSPSPAILLAAALLVLSPQGCGGPAETAASESNEIESGLLALAADRIAVAAGRDIYRTSCVVCHGENGEGLLGPNLTDRYWLHGARPSDVLRAVEQGFPERGMPPWRDALGRDACAQVTAHVLTLVGREVPGKAPQGQLVE